MLNNNCFYTHKASAYVPDNADPLLLFLLQKNFDNFVTSFFNFCLFLLQNDFDIVTSLFSETFFVFLIISICYFNDEMIDLDEVNKDQFWKKVKSNITLKTFSRVTLKLLSLKPNLNFWAPYIGKITWPCVDVLNTEGKKIRRAHQSKDE